MKIISITFFLKVLTLLPCLLFTSATEWNCTATEGNFTRTNDCDSTSIEVSADLTIVGCSGESSGVLTTLYAAVEGYNRHFYLNGQFTLTIKRLKLTGGNVSKVTNVNRDKEGGAFYMGSNGGHLVAEFCAMVNNIAYSGGAISVRPNQNLALSDITLYHTNLTNNTVDWFAGGMRLNSGSDITKTHLRVSITGGVIGNNVAVHQSGGGGAMVLEGLTHLNVTGTQIIGNNAPNRRGGGILGPTGFEGTIILKDVSFLKNAAKLRRCYTVSRWYYKRRICFSGNDPGCFRGKSDHRRLKPCPLWRCWSLFTVASRSDHD